MSKLTEAARGPRWALGVGAVWACMVGCASAPVHDDRAAPIAVDGSCDRERAASSVANGDLDGALDATAGCAPDPAVLLQRMNALVDLGEIARAKEIARSLAAGPPASRQAADEVLALAEPSSSAIDSLRDGRASVEEGARVAKNDPAAAARAYGRARHLFERATGASSTRVAIEVGGAVGWSGEQPLWSATLHRGEATDAGQRFLLVTQLDGAGAPVPIAALELGAGTPTPWPRPGGGIMLVSMDANALWSAPWLVPITLPAGTATFGPSGARVAVARGGDLQVFDANKGTRLFAWPRVQATGSGTFVAPNRYAETGASGARALVVDLTNGAVLLDDATAIASAISPSGKLVALLRVTEKPNAWPRLSLEWIDLGAPAKPKSAVDVGEAPRTSGTLALDFDGERGVAVLLSETSAMMHEGSTSVFSYVARAPGRGGRARYEAPDRFSTFARIAKLAAPGLKAPRVAIESWLHSQTYEEDRASARAVVVTGTKTAGPASHAGEPSVMFLDARAKKIVRDVPLPAAELTIDSVSIAPGGRSAIVCAIQEKNPSYLVDADTGDVLPGQFDCTDALWSADGAQRVGPAGLVTLHAKGPRALVSMALPIAGEKSAKRCLIGTVLAPIDVCR